MTKADEAICYVLSRIKSDPRIAYYFGHTEALHLLLDARAEALGVDAAEYRKSYHETLQTERPQCRGACAREQAAA